MRLKAALTLSLVLMTTAVAASDRAPLRDVPEIDDAMLWVALAIEISNKCDQINPRTLKGIATLYGLKSRARTLGYSSAEIDAYAKSPDEKARMRKRGERYVRARGLDPSSPAALCALGRTEINRSSKIGVLLRAK